MRRVLLIAVFMVAATSGTEAADVITYGTSADLAVPVAPPAKPYDWNGFYAGVFGAYQHDATGGDRFGLGVDAGVNTAFNFVLAGAEVAVTGLKGSDGTSASIAGLGRAGVLLTDDLLAYGAAGYGIDGASPGSGNLLLGGGLEFAFDSGVSLRAQYLHGTPVTGTGSSNDQVTLGAQFHF